MPVLMISSSKNLHSQLKEQQPEKVNRIQHFDSFSHLVHFVLKVGIILVIDHLGKSDLLSSSLQDRNQKIEHGESFTKVLSGYMRQTEITHLYLLLWL